MLSFPSFKSTDASHSPLPLENQAFMKWLTETWPRAMLLPIQIQWSMPHTSLTQSLGSSQITQKKIYKFRCHDCKTHRTTLDMKKQRTSHYHLSSIQSLLFQYPAFSSGWCISFKDFGAKVLSTSFPGSGCWDSGTSQPSAAVASPVLSGNEQRQPVSTLISV